MNTKFLKNWFCKLALIIMLIAIQTYVSQAQIRPRTERDSGLAQMNGNWYNSTGPKKNAEFQLPYPKLTVIPPLSTDMPYDILIAYIYADSIMRSISYKNFSIQYLQYWLSKKIKNDTITGAIKYLYKLDDYDPVRFYQYMHNQSRLYTLGLNGVIGATQQILQNIAINTNQSAIFDLYNSDYILRVKVKSIDSIPWVKSPSGYYVYNVNAEVIDTLKGHVFMNCSNNTQDPKVKKASNGIQSTSSNICFDYVTGQYPGTDVSLLDAQKNVRLQPGQELIIFISEGMYLWDYNYDYMDFTLVTVMPIINGQVKDNNYRWSSSLFLNYSDWKNAFFQKRDILLNGGY